MIHTYRLIAPATHVELGGVLIPKCEVVYTREVPQGYPHGDAWTQIAHPGEPPTHDTERYLIAQERKNKKERR